MTREWLRLLRTASLCYLALFLLIVFNSFINRYAWGTIEDSPVFLSSSLAVFFFTIVGILYPSRYTRTYLSLGITRTQLIRGIFIAGAIVSLLFALFHAAAYAVVAAIGFQRIYLAMMPLQFLKDVLVFFFCYVAGTLTWMLCSRRKFLPVLAGVVFAYLCLTRTGWIFTGALVGKATLATNIFIPQILGLVLLIIAVALVTYFLAKRIMVQPK